MGYPYRGQRKRGRQHQTGPQRQRTCRPHQQSSRDSSPCAGVARRRKLGDSGVGGGHVRVVRCRSRLGLAEAPVESGRVRGGIGQHVCVDHVPVWHPGVCGRLCGSTGFMRTTGAGTVGPVRAQHVPRLARTLRGGNGGGLVGCWISGCPLGCWSMWCTDMVTIIGDTLPLGVLIWTRWMQRLVGYQIWMDSRLDGSMNRG